MKVILQQKYYPFADLITRYKELLKLSHKILDGLSINVEKILYAKITALPRSYFSPFVRVINPEVIILSLNKDFKIVGYDKTVDISKLTWRESYLRVEFIGSVNDIKAVFILTIRGSGKDRRDYGDIEVYAYNNNFDGFDELFKKTKLNLEPILRLEGVKYLAIGPLDSRIYDVDKIIAFSTNDIRSFLSVMIKFLRKVSQRNTDVEKKAVERLNSFLNFGTLFNKIYNKDKFIKATHRSFVEKGYNVIPGSLTIYGDKPLFDGYLNFIEKVIIPSLSEFPTEKEFEDKLNKGLSNIKL
ncbi:hypothetical protein [Acidianus ambivalens]|uniref:Uncharacterized protein n=1 Tax=Acidianus ambivalens TaxID=2283 RepID=A0A650CU24_ACIAM|nr:hypothetical protein [Acidianus ambivalens]MQL56248.1 hypothetical protein [Acidianus ambivalens]QGR21215.1 hypothetical protein D1866_03745 [Acidianus ambivalens]